MSSLLNCPEALDLFDAIMRQFRERAHEFNLDRPSKERKQAHHRLHIYKQICLPGQTTITGILNLKNLSELQDERDYADITKAYLLLGASDRNLIRRIQSLRQTIGEITHNNGIRVEVQNGASEYFHGSLIGLLNVLMFLNNPEILNQLFYGELVDTQMYLKPMTDLYCLSLEESRLLLLDYVRFKDISRLHKIQKTELSSTLKTFFKNPGFYPEKSEDYKQFQSCIRQTKLKILRELLLVINERLKNNEPQYSVLGEIGTALSYSALTYLDPLSLTNLIVPLTNCLAPE